MNTLKQEALALRARHDEEPSHSDQVLKLALQLFDLLREALMLDDGARELLQAAALLHDIGWSQTATGKGHHKESARLILAQEWKALAREEVSIVAQIARYHRKAVPQADHEPFQALAKKSRELVMVLGGILRVADALDRTHTSRVEKIFAVAGENEIVVQVRAKGDWQEERAMFDLKRDMLELAAKKAVRCVEMK